MHKKGWLEANIFPAFDKENKLKELKPFAIEFCAWHSELWHGEGCEKIYNNAKLKPIIEECFINVLVDAVLHSKAKLGICIGKQFFKLFEAMGEDRAIRRDENPPEYNLHLFELVGARILCVWGKGRNRFPKIDINELKELLKNYHILDSIIRITKKILQ